MSPLLALVLALTTSPGDDRACVLVVVGAPGTPEYAAEFRRWADLWRSAAEKGGAESVRIGLDGPDGAPDPDRERLRAALAGRAGEGREPLWLVLIGHGTFDGREAKFNLRGPDVTDAELAGWLAPIKRPIAVLDCTSASAPFLARLSGEGRVVVTATRSGHEMNYARFGQFLAESIADPRADLDKDGQVSLLEAFLTAGKRVEEWYRTRSQLATEHALIDDNGDRLGTPAEWFRGVRATRRAKQDSPLDGIRAHQLYLVLGRGERGIPAEVRRRRDELERAIAALRDEKEKAGLDDDAYYAKLEPLMVELARIYGAQPVREGPSGP